MKTHKFWSVRLLVLVCIFAVGSVPMVYADAHEAGEEMAEEESSGASGWFRTDTDSLGTQIWVGASHSPSFLGSLSLDTDIYVVDTFGELDIGIGIPVADSDSLSLSFLPMVGIGFDYAECKWSFFSDCTAAFSPISPPVPSTLNRGYKGSSILPFDEEAGDSIYTRNFILYSLNDTVAIGPQVEVTLTLATLDPEDETGLSSLAPGLRANIGYGENNTLGIFVGFETQKGDDETGITGRMTLFREW